MLEFYSFCIYIYITVGVYSYPKALKTHGTWEFPTETPTRRALTIEGTHKKDPQFAETPTWEFSVWRSCPIICPMFANFRALTLSPVYGLRRSPDKGRSLTKAGGTSSDHKASTFLELRQVRNGAKPLRVEQLSG